MASIKIETAISWLGIVLGLALLVWGLGLNLTGHESAQSWSLIGVGAAAFGSSGAVSLRRRK
ncbi:MAG TPA: LPXTG cell wall anchor domain-containing protein [Candidatus Dormibacteraeota bacterium]|nr:LPXTG cell wall anchor domain-containing protein [Candidatus Dormibacteraeota bacterium]